MKRIVFISLLLSIAVLCPAQKPMQKIVKHGYFKPYLGMKGKVKSATEEVYEISYQEDGKEIKKLQEERVFEFARNGELLRKTTSFDENKNIIIYKEYVEGRAIRFEREYISSRGIIDKDSVRLFTIDMFNDRLISWNRYNQDYSYIDTTLITYSFVMTEIKPLANNRRLEIWEKYDDRNNLIDEKRLLRGDIRSWYEQIYDENDLLVERKYIEPSFYSLYYVYGKFDKHGNWQERRTQKNIDKYDDESPLITISLVVRKIKYY